MFRAVSKPACAKASLVIAVLLATLSAALLAYGTDPFWAQFRHGMGLILFTHRVQWILATISLILCLAVVALIVGGRRRAWWLATLGPDVAIARVKWPSGNGWKAVRHGGLLAVATIAT